MRDEFVPIPNYRDRKSSPIPPWTVLARKNDDSYVNQRLERVENSETRNVNCRPEQRHKEKRCSYISPQLSGVGTVQSTFSFHIISSTNGLGIGSGHQPHGSEPSHPFHDETAERMGNIVGENSSSKNTNPNRRRSCCHDLSYLSHHRGVCICRCSDSGDRGRPRSAPHPSRFHRDRR